MLSYVRIFFRNQRSFSTRSIAKTKSVKSVTSINLFAFLIQATHLFICLPECSKKFTKKSIEWKIFARRS